jgi:DNA-binding CsgD family transcriptional regulator
MLRRKGASVSVASPPGLRAERFVHDGEELVVFSYPTSTAATLGDPSETELGRVLTPAQAEIVKLVLAERSNKEIATLRSTAVSTVAKQLEQIYRRLKINSRRELAALAGRGRSAPHRRE